MSDPCQTHLVRKASSYEGYHQYLLHLIAQTTLLAAFLPHLCSSFPPRNHADKTDINTGQAVPCSQRQMDFETNKQTKIVEAPHKSFPAFVLSAYCRQLLFFHTEFWFHCRLPAQAFLWQVTRAPRRSAQSASKPELQPLCNTNRLVLQEDFLPSFLRVFPLPCQECLLFQPADNNRTVENDCYQFHESSPVLTNLQRLFACHRFYVDFCVLPKDRFSESIPHTNQPVSHKKQRFDKFFPN